MQHSLYVCRGLIILLLGSMTALAEMELETIEVVGVTPLHGSGIAAEAYPANVQMLGSEAVAEGGMDLTDTLNRRMGSVSLNAAQNNPLQPDLQYRGFTASPLLGLPQGIAVYVDGVRQNSVFGDTVHWDTLPQHTYDSINLIPGSNPLFGLNTLGGALSLRSKNGFDYDGNQALLKMGSFGRWALEAQSGGSEGDWAYYLALGVLEEDGWRDYSPSKTKNFFGKVSRHTDLTRFDLGVNLADSDLVGNGATPVQLLEEDRTAIFTRPDRTENEQFALTFNGDTTLGEQVLLVGNAFYRQHAINTLNGDDSDVEECSQENAGYLCVEDDDEETLLKDADGDPVVADESLEGASINTSKTTQVSYGVSLQTQISTTPGEMDDQLTVGAAWETGHAHYRSQTELGALDGTRLAVGGGVLDGDAFVNIKTETTHTGLYFANTLEATDALTLTLAGRWNQTRITLKDQIGTALNGDHRYARFNPSAGVTYAIDTSVRIYGAYSEATRAPTPVELTCADPDDPCRLPNAFVADPPLEQVTARTYEIGARGRTPQVGWNVAAFATTNDDDIIFISSGALTSEGYFDNIGQTRRRGIELGLNGRAFDDRLEWFASYAYIDATFQTPFTAPSANHPDAVDGEIRVEKGDRIPVSRHTWSNWAATTASRKPSRSAGNCSTTPSSTSAATNQTSSTRSTATASSTSAPVTA